MTPHPDEPLPTVERTGALALPDDERAADGVRRDLERLADVRCATLAPLVRATSVAGGVALTHLVPAGSVALATLRASGPLRLGHVLAVGDAVAQALAALHDAGLAHGGVDADAVLVAPDGSVVLAGCGLAWSDPDLPTDGRAHGRDVEALGELLRDLLGSGSAPAALAVAVVRALDPDLALRPDAASLLAQLRRCGRPEPLLDALWASPGPAPSSREAPGAQASAESAAVAAIAEGSASEADARAHRVVRTVPRPGAAPPRPLRSSARSRRGGRRAPTRGQRRLFVLVALLVLVGAGVARVAGPAGRAASAELVAPATPSTSPVAATLSPSSTPTSRAGGGPTGAASSQGEGWGQVLDALDRARTAALAAGSTARLQEVVTGTAYAADAALARAMAAAGARLEGGALVLEDVREVAADPTTAVLRVRDVRSAYAVVLADGRHEVPARGPRWWTVTLVRATPGEPWRIAEVADADLSPAGRR